MPFTFDAFLAADPSNPSLVAANALVTIFDPADAAKSPVVLSSVSGAGLANPVQVNSNGFGPAFVHESLDRLGWEGGGFTGFFTSYEGLKSVALAARDEAAASAQAASDSANLVGAPADTAMQTLIDAPDSATRGALDATYGRGLSVTNPAYGAKGDGVTNDTAAFNATISAAATFGVDVHVPAGVYVLENALVPSIARLALDNGATLRHRAGSTQAMINFTGTELRISGGTIDGNRTNQTTRGYIITGAVQDGKSITIDRVHFTGTMRAALYLNTFGGTADIQNCRFTNQAEHTGVLGDFTSILYLTSGEGGKKGLVRFNHNKCVGTATPALAGGNPGGIFLAVNGYVAGDPGSEGFADGNLSTLEAIGNHFWGYGQNCGGNDISPLHTYPAIGEARIIGNYFEKCGFSAITAKSVQNFICTGNAIINGIYSEQNVSTEGAIAYLPGYQAASTQRPRAIIANNIIQDPGGTSTAVKQYGIAVHGISTSHATDVTISNNVITGAGFGIHFDYVDDATVIGNTIKGASGGTDGTEYGIRFDNTYGRVLVSGNRISTPNGDAFYTLGKVAAAKFTLTGNEFYSALSTSWACILRGAAVAKFSGNTFEGGTLAISVAGDGTNNTAKFYWDLSNTIIAGTVSFNFAQITEAFGHIRYANAPEGLVVAAPGTMYSRSSAGGTPMLYVKLTGSGNAGWRPAGVSASGTTAERPASPQAGEPYFDTTLGKPITYSGTAWVDGTGAAV